MLRHRLDDGWTHHFREGDTIDADTGNTRRGREVSVSVRATLQRNELMNESDELSATQANDTRIMILRSPHDVAEQDWFVHESGEVWQAVSEGMTRHRPGQAMTYTAVTVRRSKERDHNAL